MSNSKKHLPTYRISNGTMFSTLRESLYITRKRKSSRRSPPPRLCRPIFLDEGDDGSLKKTKIHRLKTLASLGAIALEIRTFDIGRFRHVVDGRKNDVYSYNRTHTRVYTLHADPRRSRRRGKNPPPRVIYTDLISVYARATHEDGGQHTYIRITHGASIRSFRCAVHGDYHLSV